MIFTFQTPDSRVKFIYLNSEEEVCQIQYLEIWSLSEVEKSFPNYYYDSSKCNKAIKSLDMYVPRNFYFSEYIYL